MTRCNVMNFVTPKAAAKQELLFNKRTSEAGSCLAPALGVIKFKIVTVMILVTLYCAIYVRLKCSTNPPRFVEQKLMLSSSFGHCKIHNCQRYNFDHTLLCCLSQTLGGFVEQKLVLCCSFRCDQIHN